MAEALEEGVVTSEALEAFEAFISSYPGHPLTPGAILRASAIALGSGDTNDAARWARTLHINHPESAEAREAEAIIEEIRSSGAEVPDLAPGERYTRAEKLFNASRYEEPFEDFSAIVEAGSSPYYGDSLISLAIAQLRLKRNVEAEDALKRYLDGKTSREDEEKALYWLTIASLRQGKVALLFDTVKALKKKFPKSPYTARAVFFTGTHYEERGEGELAFKAYEEVIEGYAGTPAWREALWKVGWKAYLDGRYREAYDTFTSHLEKGALPAEDRQKLLYWGGRSAEMTGLFEEGVSSYAGICGLGALNYYCQLASQRQGLLSGGFAGGRGGRGGPGG